jgi:hypothetical protein
MVRTSIIIRHVEDAGSQVATFRGVKCSSSARFVACLSWRHDPDKYAGHVEKGDHHQEWYRIAACYIIQVAGQPRA